MKYCEKCGKEIMEEEVVCPGCGCAVVKEIKKQKYPMKIVSKAR